MKVVGVYEDLPHNSTFFETKFLLPWDKYVTTETWLKESPTQWGNHSWQAFMQVNDNVQFDKVTAKIKDIPKQHVKEGKEEVLLHPMSKWHLYSEFKNGKWWVAGFNSYGCLGLSAYLCFCLPVSIS